MSETHKQKLYCYVDETGQDTKGAMFHEPYEATVLIDGLGKTERRTVADGLRKLRVKIRKVRGVKDEADALIRLANEKPPWLGGTAYSQARLRHLPYGKYSAAVFDATISVWTSVCQKRSQTISNIRGKDHG